VNDQPPAGNEQRVLLRTATGKDSALATTVLERAGIRAHACASVAELARELDQGAGVMLIAEEALSDPAFRHVIVSLQKQPAWSDLPVLLLARTGAASMQVVDAMEMRANFTVIERPLRIFSLISSVRTALRARARQYELRAVMEGLRQADRRKTEFLATLAHELRNPLAPLSSALALLQMQALDADAARPHYAMMQRQVQHMARLIDDLMEVSRITRGKIELQLEVLQLEQIIAEAIELSRPLLKGARHQLDLVLPARSLSVRGDRVRLTQVFSNLLNNAAKYTPPGGRVTVTLEARGGRARVSVRDNGRGIPADMLVPIFEMFVQVADMPDAALGGLGIGLTLVKSLVELHGGAVSANSAGAGAGSELVVELPLLAAAETSVDHSPDAPASHLSCRVLIVDDNREAADSLAMVLQAYGAETTVAYSGEEALSVAAAIHPSVAILDIGMPQMDGCELARRLRRDPEFAQCMLIALTGWGQPEDRLRVAAAGFDHHLLKPASIAELQTLLSAREHAE